MLIKTTQQGVINHYGVQYIYNYKIVHWAVREDHTFMVTEKTSNNFHEDVYGNLKPFETQQEAMNYIGRNIIR